MNTRKSSLDIIRTSRSVQLERENHPQLFRFISQRWCRSEVISWYQELDEQLSSYIVMQTHYPNLFVNIVEIEKAQSHVKVWFEDAESLSNVMKVCKSEERKMLIKELFRALAMCQRRSHTRFFNAEILGEKQIKLFETEVGEWTLRLQPSFGFASASTQHRDRCHANDEDELDPNPFTLIVAKLLNFSNETINSNTDIEVVVMNLIIEEAEDLMASMLKFLLMNQYNHDLNSIPFNDLVHIMDVETWTPSQWLMFNFEVSNFLTEDKEGKTEMIERLKATVSLFLPNKPHNWVLTEDPDFFLEMAPNNNFKKLKEVEYTSVTSAVPVIASSSEATTSANVESTTNEDDILACYETPYDGNAVESLSRIGRNFLSHRTEKKYSNLSQYIKTLTTKSIYDWMLLKSKRIFKGLYVEASSSKIFRKERPELFQYQIELPSLACMLNLKDKEKFSPRKVNKLTKPKPASAAFKAMKKEEMIQQKKKAEKEKRREEILKERKRVQEEIRKTKMENQAKKQQSDQKKLSVQAVGYKTNSHDKASVSKSYRNDSSSGSNKRRRITDSATTAAATTAAASMPTSSPAQNPASTASSSTTENLMPLPAEKEKLPEYCTSQ